nr:MAG: penicillin acylase family protein [Pseudomonadota bacterium]
MSASGALRVRRVGRLILVLAVLLSLPLAAAFVLLAGSLPQLDGTRGLSGIRAPIAIERDALGIPTIRARTRTDLAFGTGFVHGQDRFFQMDLSRRLAAGELADLFGAAALDHDRAARTFRFRARARRVLEEATPEQRAIVEAYARGVNAALESLRSRPWEYWILGAPPEPWRPEDTVLVVYAMWWDLQYADLGRDRLRREINARSPGAECGDGWKCLTAFLYPASTEWDTPNVVLGSGDSTDRLVPPPLPEPTELDLRAPLSREPEVSSLPAEAAAGSNAWAVAGRLAGGGAALVASDMHLRLRVPATWYRARLQLADAGGTKLDLNGLTLAGAPALVAGSNGHIAWAFTNSYGDWADVVRVRCEEAEAPSLGMSRTIETIRVKGGADVSLDVLEGPYGVLVDRESDGIHCWFAQWLALDPAATNFGILALERAQSVEQALALAPGIGIPHQNAIVGDRAGRIAWTIFGRIPRENGPDRNADVSAWTDAADHPRIVDPAVGRLWSANALMSDDSAHQRAIGADETLVGAGYDLGARARQIRDGLLALGDSATPADMLRIQLDDRAEFLGRWQQLMIELLDEAALRERPERADVRKLALQWDARAMPESVSYRVVWTFRTLTERAVWDMFLEALAIDPAGKRPPPQFEGPLWRLVSERPEHLLSDAFESWRAFLLERIDATASELRASCGALTACTWGERNRVHVRHPLSSALPFASRLLDMPPMPLAGDHDMPRVQDGAFGASERFAVAPGREAEGYLHIAGGQSGHPLSRFYRAGFREWAEGRPLPFLPGPARHRLTLEPAD